MEPTDGDCPCLFDNQSPNDGTVENLVAGEEYITHILAESAFGRNSTQVAFTRSLYTDIATINNTLSTHRLQTELQFQSGVGSTVEIYLQCIDFPLSWRRREKFSLHVLFNFDDMVPGSSYSWTITGTSQGSNPLQRTYSFSDSTLPMQPISLVKAAYSLESYDTFVFTIGDQPFTDRSTRTIQFTWAQERRIEEYKISDVTLNRQLSHVIASSGWTLDDNTTLTPGMKYTFQVTSVSHGKESADSMTIEDNPYPLTPIEDSSARVVNDDGMTLTVGYPGFVQFLKVWIVPSEGNCVVGCTFDAPSTTRVELTGLRPGMEYKTTLSTESYGKESETISFTQTLMPGKMKSFLNVSTDTKVTIEFQLESGVGTDITLEYTGRYTGHNNKTIYPYKLFNRYVYTNMTPSETYDMTLTWTGQGVNYQTRMKTFEVHMYPSEVNITNVHTFAHKIQISFDTSGNFSYLEVTVSPESTQCPCILRGVGTGQVTVGDDITNPLTAGEEYFFYIRTSSFAGLKSNPIEIVKSLPVDTITANNRLVGSTAYFDITVESGVGSYIKVHFANNKLTPELYEDGDTQFRLTLRRQATITGAGICAYLSLKYYSRGSEPVQTESNHKVGLPPIPASPTPGPDLTRIQFHQYDPTNMVSALFEFYIDSQLRFDTMKYMIKSYTPIPHQHWFTERPFYLENWYAVPGGYFLNQIAFEQLQLGQNHYMIVGMESCDELSEVLELSTTNKVYSGDPYQP
ncbi:uncharacterized protein LOC142342103 [Convolutriloba macropyga]|uniref:uncharacterized protein LOC142342103 n=1 Tax=Convolutriloba macropyga TaxID=536237 RepID=UPI003F527224